MKSHIAWLEHALEAGKFEAVFGCGKFAKMHGGITSFHPKCHAEGLQSPTDSSAFWVKLVAASGEDVVPAFKVPAAPGKPYPDNDIVLHPLVSEARGEGLPNVSPAARLTLFLDRLKGVSR